MLLKRLVQGAGSKELPGSHKQGSLTDHKHLRPRIVSMSLQVEQLGRSGSKIGRTFCWTSCSSFVCFAFAAPHIQLSSGPNSKCLWVKNPVPW